MSFPSALEGRAALRRAARTAALAFAMLLAVAACAVQPPSALIEIDSTSSALWLRADEVKDYRCRIGLLQCSHSEGRLGDRRCRCVE